jgi:hypothetical protein
VPGSVFCQRPWGNVDADAQAPNGQNLNTLQGYKAIVAWVFLKSQTIDPGIRAQLA